MLEKQTTAVAFGGGVDTKTAPIHVQPSKVTLLQNGVFTTRGAIRKRNGYAALGPALSTASGAFVAPYKNELVTSDGKSIFTRDSNSNTWVNRGHCESVGVTRQPIDRVRSAEDSLNTGGWGAGMAVSGNLECTAYFTTAVPGVYPSLLTYTVRDISTGAIVASSVIDSGGLAVSLGAPVVLVLGTFFVIVFMRLTVGMFYISIPIASPGSPNARVQIGTDTAFPNFNIGTANLAQSFDAAADPTNTTAWIVWATTTVSARVQVVTLRYSAGVLTLGAIIGYVTAANPTGLGIACDTSNGKVHVVYGLTTGAVYYLNQTTGGAAVGPTLIETLAANTSLASACASMTADTGTVYYTAVVVPVPASPPYWAFIRKAAVSVGVPGAPADFVRGVGLASKPFTYGGSTYIVLYYAPVYAWNITYLGIYFVIDTDGHVVARIAQEDGAGMSISSVQPQSSAAGVFRFPIRIVRQTVASNVGPAVPVYGIDCAIVDLVNSTNRYQSQLAGDVMMINGGMLQMYDGSAAVEHGFHYSPGYIKLTNTGAGIIDAGVHGWYVTYEWVDNQGNKHRSNAISSTLTLAVGSTVTVEVPAMRLSAKASQIKISIYRTLAAGTIPYFVADMANDPTQNTLTFTDNYQDNQILGNPVLYTQSAVLNSAGPPCSSIVVYKNRLALINSEDPRQIWYSKQIVPGSPVEMNDTFYAALDQLDGVTTALGVMDDKLMLFKAHSAYYMTGTGPDQLGGNNDFSTPLLVNASSGCANPKSIQMTPDGLMYQGLKGIYMLSRGLQEVYVGAEVETLGSWGSNPVTSVVLVPNTTEVRFMLGSTALVWDYFFKQWSTWTNFAATSAASFGGVAVFINSAGQVYQETLGTFTDAGSAIVLKLITGWFSMAGELGWMRLSRVYVTGDFKSASTLQVQIAVDYDPSIVQTASGAANNPLEWRFNVTRQKCQAFQLTIQDTSTSAESFDLTGLAFLWGAKRGLAKLPATRVA